MTSRFKLLLLLFIITFALLVPRVEARSVVLSKRTPMQPMAGPSHSTPNVDPQMWADSYIPLPYTQNPNRFRPMCLGVVIRLAAVIVRERVGHRDRILNSQSHVAHTLQKAQMFGEATNDNQLMISLVTLWWELGGSDQNLVQTGWTIIADTMNLLDRQISNMRRQGYGAQH